MFVCCLLTPHIRTQSNRNSMPSKTFQPLLFDLLAYKLPKTTYADHYGKKYYSYGSGSKKRATGGVAGASTRAVSSNSLRMSQKQKINLLTKRARPFTSTKQLYDEYRARYVSNKIKTTRNLFLFLFCF